MNWVYTGIGGLTIYYGSGRVQTIQPTTPRFNEINDLISTKEDVTIEDIQEILEDPLNMKCMENTEGLIYHDNGEITYNGKVLHNVLAKTLRRLIEQGHRNLGGMKAFLERLMENPSERAIEELYTFLQYKQLPITEDGCFLAYKGVSDDYWSGHGNTSINVLQGEVDESGHILNSLGATIEIDRSQVDDDMNQTCSAGLHAGSLNYAKGHYSRVIIVKIDPVDVVSVPNDYSGQKIRVCKYDVLEDFQEEITETQVKVTEEKKIENSETEGRETPLIDRVNSYLAKKLENHDEVTLRQIQSAFSPKTPSLLSLIDALNRSSENRKTFILEVNNETPSKSVIRKK